MSLIRRLLYTALGLAATVLGVIGVWVPGLPTTPFLLIALWAFSHSSERLHSWLLRVPILKTALKEAHRFQRERTLGVHIKIIAQTCAWASFVLVAITTKSLWLSVTVALLALSCSAFTYLTPTKLRTKKNQATPRVPLN